MKKLLLLGGSHYILPVIEMAHRRGAYVITCDYLPDNIAHKYSDEYWDISIIEKELVLKKVAEEKIDGSMSFACDPGVSQLLMWRSRWGFLFSVPVRVDEAGQLGHAIETVVKESHNGVFIIEEFLTFKGFHSSADAFTVDGELQFITYTDHLFDEEADNPYTPVCIIWSSSMEMKNQEHLTRKTQHLMKLLGMKTGIYNIETCVAENGKPYIMEVSPRGGGYWIAEIQEMVMGERLIENEVRSAWGMPLLAFEVHPVDGSWCEVVVHAGKGRSGILKKIEIAGEVRSMKVGIMQPVFPALHRWM